MEATAVAAAATWSGYAWVFSGRRLGILGRNASYTSHQFMPGTRLNYGKLSGGRVVQNHFGVSRSLPEQQQGFPESESNRYSEVRSTLVVVGLDFQTAPLEVLERLAIPYSELPHAAGELSSLYHIEEAAILSIFDRFEIYVFAHALPIGHGCADMLSWMAKKSGIDIGVLHGCCYMFQGNKAARHLFEVAAGFYSLFPERRILEQIEEVAKNLQGADSFGRVMNSLFEHAISFGKLMRSQIQTEDELLSVASAVVDLSLMKLSTADSKTKVLVIGAGIMGITVIKYLVAKGFNTITVMDRTETTLPLSRDEGKRVKIICKPLNEMVSCIKEADVVFSCIESKKPLILKEHVGELDSITSKSEGLKKKYFFDIAIPRNVDDGVYQLPYVEVLNIEDIVEIVAHNKEVKKKTTTRASDVDKHVFEFQSWMNSLAPSETLKLLACLEKTRDSVLEKNVLEMGSHVPIHVKNAMKDLSMDLRDRFFCGTIQILIRHSGEQFLAKAVDRIFGITNEECSMLDT